MSQVYNPEAECVREIERLELEAGNMRRRMNRSANAEDRRVLQRQLQELEVQVEQLQTRLPQSQE